MKTQADALGQRYIDYLQGQQADELVERDDGYIEAGQGPASYFLEYKDWCEDEKKAMAFVRGRVLDIGCGAGRHSLYLQKKGLKVTGIDVSPLAVKTCKARGLKDARLLSVTQVSRRLGVFDTLVMMGNNLALLGSFKRGRWLLKRFAAITSDNGRIVAQCLDPYKTDSPYHLNYHRLNRKRGRMGGQLRIRVRYKNLASSWFDYLFLSRPELDDILKGTGWRLARFIPSGPLYCVVLEKEKKP